MAKRIRLEWKKDNETFIEECFLLTEDVDKVYVNCDYKIEIPEAISNLASMNYVMFEDDFGIFLLKPHQVINIEILHIEEE